MYNKLSESGEDEILGKSTDKDGYYVDHRW